MNLTFFFIAKRHLFSRKKQTIVAVLGVTFGIAMYVLMSGFMTGVNRILDETQFTSSPHIRIFKEEDRSLPGPLEKIDSASLIHVRHKRPESGDLYLKNASQIISILRNDKDIRGLSAQVSSPVFYNYGALKINGSLLGVNIEDENALFDIDSKMTEGTWKNLDALSNGILMGKGLAEKLDVHTGDLVSVATPYGQLITLKVTGIFSFGVGAIDNSRSYCPVSLVQKILNKDKSFITEIQIKLYDMSIAKEKSEVLEASLPYTCEDWETANAPFLSGNKLRGVMIYVVSITLLVVAGFGIYNIMSMTINEKLKDIAILKATGYSGSEIVKIFLTQAMIIGWMGAVCGVVLGIILCLLVSRIPFDGGGIINIDHLPMNFDPKYYLIAVLFGSVTTLIAGYLPARKAAGVDPVVIFRG